MIDLCKFFGVKEGEEFKFSKHSLTHRINNNRLEVLYKGEWGYTSIAFNVVITSEIEKVPKRKEFTDDELAIMRSLPKEFEWMARDNDNAIYIYGRKPEKECGGIWENKGKHKTLAIFNHLFQSIQWEDEEPVFIDDYVER